MEARDSGKVQSSAGNFVQASAEIDRTQQAAAYDIVFSPDQDLCKLWTIWTGQEVLGQSLRLSLLPEKSAQPIAIKDPAHECKQLQSLLTHIARVRVKQMLAHATADEMAVVFPS